jgi:hypothetical protein
LFEPHAVGCWKDQFLTGGFSTVISGGLKQIGHGFSSNVRVSRRARNETQSPFLEIISMNALTTAANVHILLGGHPC